MKPDAKRLTMAVILGLLFAVLSASFVMAESPVDMARAINKAIRTAERATFSGKWQEAAQIMAETKLKLEQFKTAHPGHSRLKSLESSFARLQKKIDRKLGGAPGAKRAVKSPAPPKPAPAKAAKAKPAPVKAAPPKPAAAASGSLSSGAARQLKEMIRHLDRAQKTLEKGGGDLGSGSIKRARTKYQEIEKRYGGALKTPEVSQAKQRMEDLAARIAQAKQGAKQAAAQKQAAKSEQQALIEKWRKTMTAYTMPRDAKYLGKNPGLVPEAEAVLAEYGKAQFPLGRPGELDSYAQDLQKAIIQAKATAGAADIDQKWLPRVKPFITSNDPSYLDPMGPNLNQPDKIAGMEANLAKGKALLAEYEKAFPDGKSTHFLAAAINDLRENIKHYADSKAGGTGRLAKRLQDSLASWNKYMLRNKGWTGASGKPLSLVSKSALQQFKKDLERLKVVKGASDPAIKKMQSDLAALEKENNKWRQKKTAWDNAPKPFPKAGMTSKSLQKEMLALLSDRGWDSVKKLVIVDKDWWVLKGEYRYLGTAVLLEDKEGEFFHRVSFKQNATLAGYSKTELWEIGKKIRVAK